MFIRRLEIVATAFVVGHPISVKYPLLEGCIVDTVVRTPYIAGYQHAYTI